MSLFQRQRSLRRSKHTLHIDDICKSLQPKYIMNYLTFVLLLSAVVAFANENALKTELIDSLKNKVSLAEKDKSLADQGLRLRSADGTGWCWVWECSCRGMLVQFRILIII